MEPKLEAPMSPPFLMKNTVFDTSAISAKHSATRGGYTGGGNTTDVPPGLLDSPATAYGVSKGRRDRAAGLCGGTSLNLSHYAIKLI